MCCRPRFNFLCFYFTICGIIVSFIIAIILFFIIISPTSVKFYVTQVSLTQFNLTNNNTLLHYNFRVNITSRNPNNNIIVYFREITAIAWYKDRDFASVSLATFDQGHKNTSYLQEAVFEGQSVVKFKAKQIAEYNMETSVGIYNDFAVDLDVTIRAKFGRFKSDRFQPPIIQCRRLRVPLMSSKNGEGNNNKSVAIAPFNVTRCNTGYFFTDRNAED